MPPDCASSRNQAPSGLAPPRTNRSTARSPSAPLRTARWTASYWPKNLTTWAGRTLTPRSPASAARSAASRNDNAIGFSQTTGSPCRTAAVASVAWLADELHTSTTSALASRPSSVGCTWIPYRSARSCAPCRAWTDTSQPSRCQNGTCREVMLPAPTMPTRG